jgi:hypothetical protein
MERKMSNSENFTYIVFFVCMIGLLIICGYSIVKDIRSPALRLAVYIPIVVYIPTMIITMIAIAFVK